MVKISQYAYGLTEFCLTSTFHGLYYIIRNKPRTNVFWVVTLMTMFTFMTWSCVNYIILYYDFKIKSNTVYQQEKEIDFPAITFCSQFGLSKRKLKSDFLFTLFIYAMVVNGNSTETAARNVEGKKLCNSSYTVVQNKNPLNLNGNIMEQIKQFGWSSFDAVKKCWWNNIEIECAGLFGNVGTMETGLCFLFEPIKPTEAMYKLFPDFNRSVLVDRKVVFGGTGNGLSLLLDVGHGDKCDTARKYEGNGFSVVFHDPYNLFHVLTLDPFLMLAPGFEIDLNLQQIAFNRHTDNLGVCIPPIYKFGNVSTYFKNTCLAICLVRTFVEKCNCFVSYSFLLPEKKFGNNNFSTYPACDVLTLSMCMGDMTRAKFLHSCTECIQPCLEKRYHPLLTYKRFPLKASSLPKPLHFVGNLSEMRKTYMKVNIYFDSKLSLNIMETQKITLSDLLIFFGAAIGLFLGASYMSLQEIVQLIYHNIIKLLLKVYIKKTNSTRCKIKKPCLIVNILSVVMLAVFKSAKECRRKITFKKTEIVVSQNTYKASYSKNLNIPTATTVPHIEEILEVQDV